MANQELIARLKEYRDLLAETEELGAFIKSPGDTHTTPPAPLKKKTFMRFFWPWMVAAIIAFYVFYMATAFIAMQSTIRTAGTARLAFSQMMGDTMAGMICAAIVTIVIILFGIRVAKRKRNDSNRETEYLNKIADVYQTGNTEQVVNLTYGFNQKFGTNYTSAQLRTTYLKEFLAYFVSVFKLTSDRLTERSALYHKAFAKTVKNAETGSNETLMIMRHTPKADQHALLYNPLFIDAQAQVMPSIFNPEYLRVENYEPVDFWQSNYSEALRPQINVYPAIYDDTTGTTIKGDQVQIPYVVGMLFDRDALVTDFQIDRTDSTPLEARKHYRTVWFSYSKMVYSDPSENCVIFTMEDPSEGAAVVGSAVVGTDVAG